MIAALNRAIASPRGISIPYVNVSSVSHSITANSETIRLASSLEHLMAIFLVFRSSADLNVIGANSLGHFRNCTLKEVQYTAGGNVVVPVIPLQVATASGVNPTGECMSELELALQKMPSRAGTSSLSYDQFSASVANNAGRSQLTGPLFANDAGPQHATLNLWDGSFIVGTSFTSDGAFDSVYNRGNSRNMGDHARKSDLHVRLSFHGVPADTTMTAYLMYGNVMRINQGGAVQPEQATF